jgi:SUKH-3 immunity protein
MTSLPFSSPTISLLRRAGWREGRTISTAHWEALLKSAGNPVSPVIIGFLTEYGGLTVEHPHKKLPNQRDYFSINPSRAARLFAIDGDGLQDYNDWSGHQLCAIGTAARDNALLMMTSEGNVFSAVDDLLFWLGTTGVAAIELMCTGGDWRRIH